MKFADLVAGQSVFLDANTLIYHFQPHPVFGPASTDLLKRIERQDFVGYTSPHVVAEMAHRLMTMEASALFGWPPAGVTNRMRKKPAEVQKLSRFRAAIQDVALMRIQVLP